MTSLQKELEYLYELKTRGMKLGLINISKLLERLGNPHQDPNIKFIHVTGTNGKGSVCAMLSAILSKVGYKVGMFTSPHLVTVRERIKINDKPIRESVLLSYIKNIRPHVDEIGNTFFETINAIAFQYFADQEVDFALVEVGLGGSLDSTNVIKPKIAVMTDIGLDHTHILGDKIETITKDKCGIIKDGIDVVTSNNGEILEMIKKACEAKHARCFKTTSSGTPTNLQGTFQERNVALAEKVAQLLQIPSTIIQEGLMNVDWPGRMEFVRYDGASFLLDCAHNPAACTVLKEELQKINKKKIVILSFCEDKDIAACIEKLTDPDYEFILTKADIDRAADPKALSKYLPGAMIIEDLDEAVEKAISMNVDNEKLIVVTGSIFLVGEFLGLLSKQKCYAIGY